MDQQAPPTSIAQVEALIISLYQPNPPHVIARTQSTLARLQGSPEAWRMARELMDCPDDKVKFFGVLTIIIKLNNESASLADEDAVELLLSLIGWYMQSLTNGSGPLVARKLSSALATFFLRFHRLWRHAARHLGLCFLSGQPHPPHQIDAPHHVAAELASLQALDLQAVLSVLSNILEDVTKIDLNAANNMGLYDAVLDNVLDAVALIRKGMSPHFSSSHQVRQDSIKCLQSWIWFAQRSASRDSHLLQTLGSLATNVIGSLIDDELFEVSAELLVDVLSNYSTFFTEEHYSMLARLIESPWFKDRYQQLVQGDFDFDSVQLGQLLLAFGDAQVEQLMQSKDDQSQYILSSLCGLLAADGYPVVDDKIFVPALEFWSTFAETMTDCMYSDERAADVWVQSALSHVLQAVSNAWQKIAYPPPEELASWDSSERVGFSDARKDVVDLLQSAFTLAGPRLVSTFATLTLEALLSSSWSQLEAAAFCLGGLADCTGEDTRSDAALASVFSSSLFPMLHPGRASMPPKVRQTCVSLIEHYTEYFERNISDLHPALNLLFVVVGEQPMATAAAKSILRLCSSCRSHLYPDVDAFLNEYQRLVVNQKLDCVAGEKILGGIASVVQAIPDSRQKYSATDRLLAFVESDAELSLKLLQSPEGNSIPCFSDYSCSYASSDESPALHTALRALRCLVSIGKGLQAPSDITLELEGDHQRVHDSSPYLGQLQERVVCVMVQIQRAFETVGEITEIIYSILRCGFSESEPGPFVLPSDVVARYLTRHGMGTPRIGLLVKTACSFMSSLEHDKPRGQDDILTTVLLWVVGLLRQLPNPEADPELAQNGIEFVSRLLSKRTAILMRLQPQDAAEFVFLFTLQVLDGKEPLPKASAAEFWANFIGTKPDAGEVEKEIEQAMNMLGPLLSQTLARNIGGNASRSELDKVSEPLKKLVNRYAMARNWLEAGLSHPSFPSSNVTAEEKSLFVKKVVSLRGAKTTNQVVREFWLSARGSNFAYAT